MKRNKSNSGIFICYYYYYGTGKHEYNNEKNKQIELSLQIIEGTVQILDFMTNNAYVKEKIKEHFNKMKNNRNKQKKDYNYYKSFVQHFNEVRNLAKKSVKDIRSKCLKSDYTNSLWNNLHIVGLTGVKIETKFNYWSSLFNEIDDFIKNLTNNIKNNYEKFINFFNSIYKTIVKFFRYTNALLLSICRAIPFAEIVKECKDLIEQFYSDWEPDPEVIIGD